MTWPNSDFFGQMRFWPNAVWPNAGMTDSFELFPSASLQDFLGTSYLHLFFCFHLVFTHGVFSQFWVQVVFTEDARLRPVRLRSIRLRSVGRSWNWPKSIAPFSTWENSHKATAKITCWAKLRKVIVDITVNMKFAYEHFDNSRIVRILVVLFLLKFVCCQVGISSNDISLEVVLLLKFR